MLAAFAAGFLPGLDFNQQFPSGMKVFSPTFVGCIKTGVYSEFFFDRTQCAWWISRLQKLLHFIWLHFAADECLRLQPRLSLLFSAAYG